MLLNLTQRSGSTHFWIGMKTNSRHIGVNPLTCKEHKL
jgi:hypothetical protein